MQTLSLQKLKQGGYYHQGDKIEYKSVSDLLQKLAQERVGARISRKSVSDFPINQIVMHIEHQYRGYPFDRSDFSIYVPEFIDCIPYMHLGYSINGSYMIPGMDASYYFTYGDLHPNVKIYIAPQRVGSYIHMYRDNKLGALYYDGGKDGIGRQYTRLEYLSPIIFKNYKKEERINVLEKYIHSLENRVKSLEKAQRQKVNSQTIDSSYLFRQQQQQQPLIDLQYNPKELRKKKSKDLKKDTVNKARQLQQALM